MPTKTSLRFYLLLAVLLLLGTARAFAQAVPDITLQLSPTEVAEISRLVDLQPISKAPPATFWDLQIKIGEALKTNPAAARAVLAIRSAAR